VIRAKSLEVKLGSSEKGQLEVTFGECNLEVGEAPREEESANGWGIASIDSNKDSAPISSSGSDSDVTASSSSSTGLSSRSPWKSSRIIEASAAASIDDGSKSTIR
jgi:hypothetical protein